MKKGLLIIMSGPSGVGKGAIRAKIMEDSSLNLFYSVSMTTRAMRSGEQEGREYYFVSKEDFLNRLDKGDLLEYNCYVGNYYGTPKDKVEEKRLEGKNVLLEIDVQGASKVMDALKDEDVLSIFILPPSLDELEKRVRGRHSETEESIKGRLDKAKSEIPMKDRYKYVVINDDLDRCASEIKSIIKRESK